MTVVPIGSSLVRTQRPQPVATLRPPVARPVALSRSLVIVLAGTAALLVWLLVSPPDPTQLRLPAVTSWWWVAVALVACAASFWAAGAVVVAASPVRVGGRVAAVAQLAAAATKLVTPACLGLVGVNARLLTRHGALPATALATVAASQVAQFVVTVAGLLALAPLAGDLLPASVPGSTIWWTAGAGVLVAAAAVGLTRSRGLRARLVDGVRPLAVLRSPRRATVMVIGSAGLTASLATCLWACVAALGGDADTIGVVLVLLVGTALGSLVPTPGGIGGVEGAMVAGLVATGLAMEVAVPAVLLFRLVTFWLPVPFGAVGLAWLRRAGHL